MAAGADEVVPAILRYVEVGSFPESEIIASKVIGPAQLGHILAALRKEQDVVKSEIRAVSKDAASDVDTWIARAKELQADIARSRDTARQIVAAADAASDDRARAKDAENKVRLLEKEVGFQDMLAATLDHVRFANGLLDKTQSAAVGLELGAAYARLEDAEASIAALEGVQSSRACEVLTKRALKLREDVTEAATSAWNDLVHVKAGAGVIEIHDSWSKAPNVTLNDTVTVLARLERLDALNSKLARDVNRVILRPMWRRTDLDIDSRFETLTESLQYFAHGLPPQLSRLLSEKLTPGMAADLEDHWLEPAIPLEMPELPELDRILGRVTTFANDLDSFGWVGSQSLRNWTESAPRTWLTKRREAVLGQVRSLVFTGLRERRQVERIETQVFNQDEAAMAKFSDKSSDQDTTDEWDNGWEEPRSEHVSVSNQSDAKDNDDVSAWDMEDGTDKPSSDTGETEDDAWDAWADDEGAKSSATRLFTRPHAARANGGAMGKPEEITIRETYTVTAVPAGLLEVLKEVIIDAQTLAGPDFATSPVAPAATALYTLPTLALAIYRATASTAYGKLDVGNVLTYNDAGRLADQLKEWQTAQPPASRLRVDNDVKALEQFAKQAYSSEMESQRTILRDLLDGAQGFGNCTVLPFKAECESAVEQVVGRLRDVERQWRGVLSDSALLQSLGSLLSTVITKMINEIEELGDISEADSVQLRHLCDALTEVKDIFAQRMPDGSENDMTFMYCPNWLKFQYLAEILESSLADIKYLWNEGQLSLDFEAGEVEDLIEALFAESDIRRKTITEIRRNSRR